MHNPTIALTIADTTRVKLLLLSGLFIEINECQNAIIRKKRYLL